MLRHAHPEWQEKGPCRLAGRWWPGTSSHLPAGSRYLACGKAPVRWPNEARVKWLAREMVATGQPLGYMQRESRSPPESPTDNVRDLEAWAFPCGTGPLLYINPEASGGR